MSRSLRQKQRGNAIVVGLMLGTLLGFSALAVDIGMIRVADTQLQAAIDAAAVSAASELDGTPTGIANARARAAQIATANPVLDGTLALAADDVEVGIHDPGTGSFTADESDPAVVNAVRIDHSPPQLDSVLGGVAFGVAGYTVSARSMAVRPLGAGPARTTKCFLPLAIPDCWVSGTAPGTNPPPLMFTFNPTPTDGVAWGHPDENPSSALVEAQLLGTCDHDPIEVGDPIHVNEGVHNSALHTVRDILNGASPREPGTWDTSLYGPLPPRDGTPDTANTVGHSDVTVANWGNTLEGPVALIDAGPDCSNVSFTGSHPMTGIAWAILYDVRSTGNPKNVYVQLDLVNEHDIWGEIDPDLEGNVLAPEVPVLVNW